MIRITPTAASYLRALIRHSRGQPGQALRVIPNGKNGLVMTMSLTSPGDTVLEDASGPVLIIGGALAARLDGLMFDQLVTEVDGRQVVSYSFRRPIGDELEAPSQPAAPR